MKKACGLLLAWVAAVSAAARKPTEADYGNALPDRGCKGLLQHPCVCDQVSVECVNGQFTTDEIFLNVGIHFSYLETVAFHGNNFNNLGEKTGHLFGAGVTHPRLLNLNLSANYIVKIHPQAFLGLPRLEQLDLSNNELFLNDPDSLPLLEPLPQLKGLYMKKAFSRPSDFDSNSTSYQLEILEGVFRSANLQRLTMLDLSWNFLKFVPYSFACALPALTHLIFRNNYLETLNLNTTCLQKIQVLDLRGNNFQHLGMMFRLTAAGLPTYTVLMEANDFHCDCHSEPGLLWLRSSTSIRDADALRCRLASPRRFEGAKLLSLPLDELDCATVLSAAAASGVCLVPFLVVASCWRMV